MGGFQGCSRDKQRNNWRCARAVRKRPLDIVARQSKTKHPTISSPAKCPSLIGRPKGITEEDYNASLETVHRVAADLKAAATLVVEKVVKEAPKLQCAELLVRRVGEDSYIDMRIAICGNVDSGKSTFVGVLTKGVLDNGRGSVRQKVFRHKHEMDTGLNGVEVVGMHAAVDITALHDTSLHFPGGGVRVLGSLLYAVRSEQLLNQWDLNGPVFYPVYLWCLLLSFCLLSATGPFRFLLRFLD